MQKDNLWIIVLVVVIAALVGYGFLSGGQEEAANTPTTADTAQLQTPPTTPPATDDAMMENEAMEEETTQPTQNIVEIAAGNDDFSTLVTAVTEAGLVETLSGPGPFTVFAPTNAAFDKLGDETLQAVLADQELLTSVLTYHVVSGEVMAEQVVTLDSATTVEGSDVTITVQDGNVFVNDAQVLVTDIQATNGVIHVIDTVLLPETE